MKLPRLKATDKRSKVDQVADALEQAIKQGKYKPGQRLPRSAEMCEHFQVSQPTMTQATRYLKEKGLVQSQRGGNTGIVVTDQQQLILDRLQAIEQRLTQLEQQAQPIRRASARVT